MYEAVFVALIGVVGLALLRWVKCRLPTHCALVGAVVWTVVIDFRISRKVMAHFTRALLADRIPVVPLTACGCVAVAVFLYGLSRFWPVEGQALWLVRKRALKSILIGSAGGCLLALALTQLSSHISVRHYDFFPLLLSASIVPLSILEEAIYRGRLFDAALVIAKRKDAALLMQAAVFAGVHIPGIMFVAGPHGYPELARQAAIVFLLGCVFGLMRVWRDDLWTSTSAHVVYNILAWLSLASV